MTRSPASFFLSPGVLAVAKPRMSSSSCILLRMKSLLSPPFTSFCPSPSKIHVGLLPLSSSTSPFSGHRCASKRIVPRSCATAPHPSLFRSLHVRSVRMNAGRSHSGEIHVIVGPMFAGKTTALLRRIELESSNGRNVAVIKSNKDTRYGLDSIVTHDGARLPCLALADLSSFKQKFGLDAYDKLDVIGIDEAQFFGDLYEFCHEAADRHGKSVIVAGLDGDYMRRRFGSVLDIIPLADTVTKLSARCELCGKRAFFTLRKTDDTQTELIGGHEIYMPVCRQHYVSGQAALETTRIVLESQSQEVRSG